MNCQVAGCTLLSHHKLRDGTLVCSVHFLANRKAQLRKAAMRYYFRKMYGYYRKGMGQRLYKWIDASQDHPYTQQDESGNDETTL